MTPSCDLFDEPVAEPCTTPVQTVSISFRVDGIPKGQPRPRAFARKMGNTFAARVYDCGTAEGWKSEIALAARSFIPKSPLTGPIKVTLYFDIPRPKGHYRTGKHAGELKADAPRWHFGKPDCDNCAKAVLDALTQLRMWSDDGQVAILNIEKEYGDKPGCTIVVEALT